MLYDVEISAFASIKFVNTDKVKFDYYLANDHQASFTVKAGSRLMAANRFLAAIGNDDNVDWEQAIYVSPRGKGDGEFFCLDDYGDNYVVDESINSW